MRIPNPILGLALGTGLALAACTDAAAPSMAPQAGAAPAGAQQAYFAGYPAGLFFAAGEVCDGPGQSVVRPTQNEVRCESLPDPESAAAIILQFDGTIEDLPQLVTSFVGRDTQAGYLVTADNYIRVPRIDRNLAELLTAAGGRPL